LGIFWLWRGFDLVVRLIFLAYLPTQAAYPVPHAAYSGHPRSLLRHSRTLLATPPIVYTQLKGFDNKLAAVAA